MKQLYDLQTQMKSLQEDMNAIHHPRVRRKTSEILDPTTRIKGTTWANEMDIRDPLMLTKGTGNCNKVCIVEAGGRMEEHLVIDCLE